MIINYNLTIFLTLSILHQIFLLININLKVLHKPKLMFSTTEHLGFFFPPHTRNLLYLRSIYLSLSLTHTHHCHTATNKAKTNKSMIGYFNQHLLHFPSLEWCLASEMFPLNSWVPVLAFGGIRAQSTDSVAHLCSESTDLETKVACGHVQWYDNSVKWETHFKSESLPSAAERLSCAPFDVATHRGCERHGRRLK